MIETSKYFDISTSMFLHILRYYNIHKDVKSHMEQIKKTKLERYNNINYNNRAQAKETCLERYGVENPFRDTEKIKLSYMKKFGVTHPMKLHDISMKVAMSHNYKEIWEKAHNTYFLRTGFRNQSYNKACIIKGIQSKLKNGVYDHPHNSNLEQRLLLLLSNQFKEVKHGYRDKRYARDSGYMFECDFYIPEEDLFIELNAHPTHNNHPYNEKLDKNEKVSLENSIKLWDKCLFETWTIRDVEKIEIARKSNLNYLMLYPTNTIEANISFNDKKYSSLITNLLTNLNN